MAAQPALPSAVNVAISNVPGSPTMLDEQGPLLDAAVAGLKELRAPRSDPQQKEHQCIPQQYRACAT
jgi:hypothetical protein